MLAAADAVLFVSLAAGATAGLVLRDVTPARTKIHKLFREIASQWSLFGLQFFFKL